MVCPNCQTENKPGARFCRQCGHPLPRAAAASVPVPNPAARPQPEPRRTGTRPLAAQPAFGPRPEGAIFGSRFLLSRLDFRDANQVRYRVTQVGVGEDERIRQCAQCGAVHAQPGKYCTDCSTTLETGQFPPLALTETGARDFYGAAYTLASQGLAHTSLRVPVMAFEERVGGAPRYCVVGPVWQTLPEGAERSQVLAWAPGLAQGLDYLHSVGVTFGGQADRAWLGLADGRAVWTDLRQATIHPDLAERSRQADVRALAQMVFTWLTGQERFAPDPALGSPLNEVFAQALAGPGFATAALLAEALQSAQDQMAARPSLELRVGRLTSVGRVRQLNEDCFATLDLVRSLQSVGQPLGVYVVADGMGGQAAGEVASSTVVNALAEQAARDLLAARAGAEAQFDYLAWLREAVNVANKAVYDKRKAAGNDMGSTLVIAVVDGNRAYVANVGDSRIYLIRPGGEVKRLTIDHSLVERLVAINQITPEQARSHPQRNVVYRTMGDKPRVDVDAAAHTLEVGDRLLLCSDGLTGPVDDAMLARLATGPAPQAACEELIKAANAGGGDDNITAVIVEVAQLAEPGR